MALSLAGIGVYGVLACQVTERRREIGIRVALGSSAADVFPLVMREGARITIVGILVGLAGTMGMARLMAGLLYGVRPTDPTVVGAVAIVLATVALVATWLPARRGRGESGGRIERIGSHLEAGRLEDVLRPKSQAAQQGPRTSDVQGPRTRA